MYRYISLNPNSNQNSLNINKKPQKTTPISLLSGGNSFFVKIKSNQIATNYNDKNNKVKNKPFQKINNTYLTKESQNKSISKYLNNSQPKTIFLFNSNNSLEYKKISNNKSLNNQIKQDISSHKKGIYSFSSLNYREKANNKSINSSSIRKNNNELLLNEPEYRKVNYNKILTNHEKNKEIKKINKDNNENKIYSNNTYEYRTNPIKSLNSKPKINNKLTIEPITKKKLKIIPEKNTNKNKNNNQIKLTKKNQYITNINNKNTNKNKNISNILFNTNTILEKNKHKNEEKNNSEGKNRIIFNGHKVNNKLINNNNLNINDIKNNINFVKENIKIVQKSNYNSLSKRRVGKKLNSTNTNTNNDNLKLKNSNNLKINFNSTFTEKSSIVQKKSQEKNMNTNKHNKHTTAKSNNILNKNQKLDNSLQEKKLNLNFILNDLAHLNSKNEHKQGNTNIINSNINSIKNMIEMNYQKDFKKRNKNKITSLNSFNFDNNNNKINNINPNLIISNNYLYNLIPFDTLNISVEDENESKLKLNRNSFFESNYHANTSQNIQSDQKLNYSTIPDSKINKENKNKINNKYKNDQNQVKLNINNSNNNKNYIINKAYNFQSKFISQNSLDFNNNKNKINKNNLNLHFYKENNNNNISENYASKEKNKKRKQNPPLNKIPKKLNILSIIQENNKKIKTNNIRRKQIFSGPLNNNKNFNNKNESITIENILYPENDTLNDSTEMFDNFDDMNTIVKKINFENIDLRKNNIFTVENKYNGKNENNNFWYEKYKENFNNIFDKKFKNNKQNMSAYQNKIKKTNYIYHSRQSGSTKASNQENSSIKKVKISSYIGKGLDKSGLKNVNKNV